jgi:type III secretion system chaperone SycN
MFIDTELTVFGDSLGVKDLHFNDKGCIKFSFEQGRTIFLEKGDEKVYFYILKEFSLAPLPFELYTKALIDCKNQQKHPFTIQAISKTDHDIGFLISIRDNECDQPTIYKIFEFLLQKIDNFS